MKTLQKTLLALATGAFLTTGANAVVNYDNGMTAQPYIGAKIGQYDADGADDAAFSYGLYGGAKFTPNFGVEAEYLTTNSADGTDDGDEYEGEVYGIYGTYDYYFPTMNGLYAKGRLGYAKNEIELDFKSSPDGTFDDSGIAGGLGLGYDISPNAAVELAYDWYPSIEDEDSNYEVDTDVSGVTLGAKFKF